MDCIHLRSYSPPCRSRLSPRALWLLDEPMGPLDARWRAVFAEVMQRHLRSDGLILAAVHDALPMPVRTLDLGGLG